VLLHVFCSCGGGDGVFLRAFFRIVWNMSGKTCWGRCESLVALVALLLLLLLLLGLLHSVRHTS